MKREDLVINQERIVLKKQDISRRDWKTLIKVLNLPTEKEGFDINEIIIPENKIGCKVVIDDNQRTKLEIVEDHSIMKEFNRQGE